MTLPKAAPTTRIPLAGIKAGRLNTPWLMTIYGLPGVGKSTLAASMPSPMFVCAEKRGADELVVSRYPEPLERFPDVLEAIRRLRTESHDFKSLVFDKVDDIEQLVFAEVIDKDPKKPLTVELSHGGYNKGFDFAVDLWRQIFGEIERLQESRGMAAVFLSSAVRHKFKNPVGEDYMQWGPGIHGKAAQALVSWCKEVLFAEIESGAMKTDSKKILGVSTGVRLLRTQWNAAYMAKNRHNLPATLSLDYGSLFEAMADQPAVAWPRIAELLAELADPAITAKVEESIKSDGSGTAHAVIENRLRATLRARKGE